MGLLICLGGIWSAGRAGISRLISSYGIASGLSSPADRAVRLNPTDPEAHYARAVVLSKAGRLSEAIQEFEYGIALRPRDYYLWLKLGLARDQNGDEQGALAAFREAVRLAPYYGQPHWQLGNLLLRSGHFDEAFAELRRAVAGDPQLLPALVDLAWRVSDGDTSFVEQYIQPQTSLTHIVVARFFLKHGKAAEAVSQLREAGSISDKAQHEFLTELLNAKLFPQAYQVWLIGRNSEDGRHEFSGITNGGLEEPIRFNDPGFGWQISTAMPGVRIGIDKLEPGSGARSLRLDFDGDPKQATPYISQLVLVEPNSRYRLRFVVRTNEVVTVGLPVVAITDASSVEGRLLAQSQPLPQGTSHWQNYAVEFATSAGSGAVLISVQRQNCTASPCPIVGRVWLDDFSLQRLTES